LFEFESFASDGELTLLEFEADKQELDALLFVHGEEDTRFSLIEWEGCEMLS
jgi:hypothetical protein